jgi:CheY-like chemotaxis protein
MLGTRLLLISSSARIRQQVLRALNSTGCEVGCVEDLAAAKEEILKTRPRIVLIDVDEPTESVAEFLRYMVSDRPMLPVLLLSQRASKEPLITLLSGQNLSNLIAKHGAINASEELLDEHELIVTCEKLLRRDIFGLEKYLSGWGIHTHTIEITHSRQKTGAIEQFENFARRVEAAGQIIQAAALVADELITNAVFNAPRDSKGVPKYASLPRNQDLQLEPSEKVLFRYACDGRYLGMSVSDPFGSLHRETVIGYLRKCFNRGADQIDQKDGGAGLGIYMLFNSLTQLIFNIHHGRCTEVVATFYIRGGYRAFRKSGQSLNVFVTSDDTGQVALNDAPAPATEASICVVREGVGRLTVTLAGPLGDAPDLDAHISALRGQVSFDLRGLTSTTRVGALALARQLRELSAQATVSLNHCPPSLVAVMNAEPHEFALLNVVSVLLPMGCQNCPAQEMQVVQLHNRRAVPFTTPACGACGRRMRAQADEARYFKFLEPAAPPP